MFSRLHDLERDQLLGQPSLRQAREGRCVASSWKRPIALVARNERALQLLLMLFLVGLHKLEGRAVPKAEADRRRSSGWLSSHRTAAGCFSNQSAMLAQPRIVLAKRRIEVSNHTLLLLKRSIEFLIHARLH